MNSKAMVEVLRDAGVEVRDQPVSPTALGLPDGARARLLVDQDLFCVYCAENLPSMLPMARVKGVLKASGDEALLLMDRGGERFVALHTTADGDDTQVELGEATVARLLPNVRAREGEDPFAVSERVLNLLLHPEEEREAYQNRRLFSDDYLKYRLTDPSQNPEWEDDISQAYEEMRELYESKKAVLDGLNEAQTESEFLDEALKVLGHAFVKQTRTRDGSKPDYALFGDDGTKDEALRAQGDPTRLYASALTVAEGKYWGRSLDVYARRDDKDSEATASQKSSPEMQISRYLQETGISWGILTNGSEWRLYHGGAPGKTKRYYSVDLVRALESDNEEDFRRFYLFFRRDAFVRKGAEGQSFLDRVLDGSDKYAVRVGKELKDIIFTGVFPTLARGFLKFRREELELPVDEDALRLIYRGSLTLLYRLLFLLYAEARDLLPAGDHYGYGARSINRIRDEVAEKISTPYKYTGSEYPVWHRLENLFRIVDEGNPTLNVPAYNGGLFEDEGSHALPRDHKLSDEHLSEVVHALSRRRDEDTGQYRNIDYGFIGVRELGSVYEGLLEFSLRIADEALVVVKDKGKEVYVPKGSQGRKRVLGSVKKGEPYLVNDKKERKATGAYYTPRYIVDYIMENTLAPLVEERREALEEKLAEIAKLRKDLRRMRKNDDYISGEVRRMDALGTLLDVKVLDPAMGSGHFLVAAVDYLTDEFSRVIAELDAEPVVEELAALRAEIRASLEAYGASASDEQLSDANLLKRMILKRCVYGVDLNEMAVELAKLSLWLDAFTVGAPLSFLDHHLKHGNSLIGSSVREVRRELAGSGALSGTTFEGLLSGAETMHELEEIPDATITQVRESASLYTVADKILDPMKRVMDVWTSKHFGNASTETVLKDELSTKNFSGLQRGDLSSFSDRGRKVFESAAALREDKTFFHWELEFPEVFYEGAKERENSGFDAVVGNPPYVSAPAMVREMPDLRVYLTNTVNLLTMKWDLYCAFLALEWSLLAPRGRLGAIVPNQFMYQDYAAPLRLTFARDAEISRIVDLGNTVVFEDVSVMTCILGLAKDSRFEDGRVSAAATQERYLSTLQETTHYLVPQRLFLELPNNVYRLTLDSFAYALVRKLLQRSYPLGKLCYGSVGVVPHSEKLNKPKEDFIFDRRVNDKCKRYIEGKNADRYLIKWDGSWLEYDYDVVRRPSLPELLETDKIALKIVAGRTGLRAVYDDNAFYTDHSFVLFALKKQLEDVKSRDLHLEPENVELSSRYDLLAILALINSKLLGWLFRSYLSSDLNIGPDDARRLPIQVINFSASPRERASSLDKSIALYHNGHKTLLSHVTTWMKAQPTQSDLVQDLLAYLAREMVSMHKGRKEITQAWHEWAETKTTNHSGLTKEFWEEVWVEA